MELVKQWVKIEPYDGLKISKNLEIASRTCYHTQDKIGSESYKDLMKSCIARGHESVLEHEKITIQMLCDVGCYKDITRHRTGVSYSIESTRYCNYSKEKFTGAIKFIDPVFIENKENYETYIKAMNLAEECYMEMANNGAKIDDLRMLLPHSTAAIVTMTANIREWRHIFSLRATCHAHPSIRQVLIPVLLQFKKDMPELFDDVPYDETFKKEWYAELSWLER